MNHRTYLLVTVSRALHDTEQARTWMTNTLQICIGGIAPRTVWNGGAEKGDRDASLIAHKLGAWVYEYRTDGNVYTLDHDNRFHLQARWWGSEGSVHPLERNRFMVRRCVEGRDAGMTIRFLGLVAPWSKTHGTDHTLSQARHWGFTDERITRLECPREYGALHG